MKVVEAMKEYALKVEYAERHLVIHPDRWFRVYERIRGRKSRLIYKTLSEDEAVAVLVGKAQEAEGAKP